MSELMVKVNECQKMEIMVGWETPSSVHYSKCLKTNFILDGWKYDIVDMGTRKPLSLAVMNLEQSQK